MAKSNLQYFQNDWNKTVNWANTQKISKSQWYPVYQLDLQRYANGEYPMSQAERARAILSSASLDAQTVLPTDNPSPTNIFGNTFHDLTNIFTGLEPTRLVSNIFDEFKNTLEHPQWLADPTKNTLMQWLPGWADIGELKTGGISDLASHPLVSFLDVLPLASTATKLAARTSMGADVAGRLGMTPEQMAAAGPIRLAGKALSKLPATRSGAAMLPEPAALSTRLAEAAPGAKVLKSLTVGERWKQYARSMGLSRSEADLMAGALKENHEQTQIHVTLAKPFYDTISKLSKADQQLVYQLLQHSGQSYTTLINDDTLAVNVRQAIKEYEPIEDWFNETILSSDKFAKVRLPDGTEEYYSATSSNPVIKARNTAENALARLDKVSAVSDSIAAEIQRADSEAAPLFGRLQSMQQQIYNAVKSSDLNPTGAALDPGAVGNLFDHNTVPIHRYANLPESREADDPLHGRVHGTYFTLSRGKGKPLDDYETFARGEKVEGLGSLEGSLDVSNVVHDSAGIAALKKLISPDEYTRLSLLNTYDLRREIETRFGVHLANKYAHTREGLLEAYGAQLAKQQGFKSIIHHGVNEFVSLHPSSVKGVFNSERVGRLFEQDEPANKFQVQALDDIFSPGGLIDQLRSTYNKGDWKAYKAVALQLTRKFSGSNFEHIGPDLAMVRHLANEIYSYSKFRARKEDAFAKAFDTNTVAAQKAATKAQTDFEKAVFRNPPSRFRPAYLDSYIANLIRHDKGSQTLDKMAQFLRTNKAPEDQVLAARSNPRVLYELVNMMSKSTSTDIMSGLMDRDMEAEVTKSALEEVQRLRSQGFVPHYIPNVGATRVGERISYNVTINTTHIPSEDAAYERMMDFTNTVYDVAASASKGIKQTLSRDGTLDYMDNDVQQHLYPVADLNETFLREYPLTAQMDAGTRDAYFLNIVKNEWGLQPFDPNAIFGLSSAKIQKDAFYIPTDLAKSLDKIVNQGQQLDKSLFGKGTKIFRTAVLGYSPRFIAHIVFGGSFLVGLRVTPHVFSFIPDAYRMAKEGTSDVLRTSTQRGADPVELQIAAGFRQSGSDRVAAADKNMHWWGGVKMRNFLLKEQMDKLGLDPSKIGSWLQVLPSLTFKLTNFVTNMQRSLVYLDGAAKVERRGWILDETGHKVSVTPERAHEEGMKAAEKVMGDLRHMTPLERHTFTKIMPFYGWTKHILKYVASYPSDHPYRAMFLSNLANMNSEDVPSALPTRLQLLFFLGSPSPDGSVTALDVRALNPLRDTANYATWGGFLSSLNPAFTAPVAMVDPSIVFGDNVLYPNLQYNQLYGVKEAAPAGGPLTALEQYVPQVTALDEALGLSAQYRNLRKTDPAGFAKSIFESLGLPFMPQQVNVRQLAATNEIDRYQQASQDALNAWQSGDFSSIAGYPTVPDPLQPDYNITPMALEALYNNALAATGQPPSEVVPSLPAPNI